MVYDASPRSYPRLNHVLSPSANHECKCSIPFSNHSVTAALFCLSSRKVLSPLWRNKHLAVYLSPSLDSVTQTDLRSGADMQLHTAADLLPIKLINHCRKQPMSISASYESRRLPVPPDGNFNFPDCSTYQIPDLDASQAALLLKIDFFSLSLVLSRYSIDQFVFFRCL